MHHSDVIWRICDAKIPIKFSYVDSQDDGKIASQNSAESELRIERQCKKKVFLSIDIIVRLQAKCCCCYAMDVRVQVCIAGAFHHMHMYAIWIRCKQRASAAATLHCTITPTQLPRFVVARN